MNPDTDFGRRVSDWLHADAEHRVPDHLDAVLRRTRTERQRSAWSSPERWLPMDLTLRPALDVLPLRIRLVGLLAVVVLVAAVALVFAIGAQRRVPPPFGLAANGVIIASLDDDLFLVDADGSNRRPLVVGPTIDFDAKFSRDGSRFAFLRELAPDDGPLPFPFDYPQRPLQLMVASADGSGIRPMIERRLDRAESYAWSPSGDRIALLRNVGSRRVLSIVDTDDPTSFRDVALPPVLPPAHDLFWRPDGNELILTASPNNPMFPGIFAMAPDGRGFREIVPRLRTPILWRVDLSPDGQWLTYQRGDSVHRVDVETGVDRELFKAEGFLLSPDGKTGLLVHCPKECRGAIVPVDGSSPGRPVEFEPPADPGALRESAIAFSPDGTTILLTAGQPPVLIDVASGRATVGEAAFGWFESWQRLPMP